jgi:hypothetical protein
MAGAREGAHRFEAGGVASEHVANGGVQLGAEHQCGGSGGRAQVGEARCVGVVEVEHVPGCSGRQHPAGEAVHSRGCAARSTLAGAGERTGQPVDERGDVSPVASTLAHLALEQRLAAHASAPR